MNSDPIVIHVRRWGYVLFGALAAAGGLWLFSVAWRNPGGFMVLDNPFAWIVAGLIALLLSGVAVAADYYRHPPEIRMSVEGLRLLTPGRERFWRWSQIDQYRMMNIRAPYVEFRWHPPVGSEPGKGRWQSLDFDIPLLGHQLRDMLAAAQKAAAAGADAAEFHRAVEAAKDDYPRLTRRQEALVVGFMLANLLLVTVFAVAVHR